eukprot:4361904-Prymnesium_polylepis.1
MHCSSNQQRQLAMMMVDHTGNQLLTYEELVATGRAQKLPPVDLKNRILLKGKVEQSSLEATVITAQRKSSRFRRVSRFLKSTAHLSSTCGSSRRSIDTPGEVSPPGRQRASTAKFYSKMKGETNEYYMSVLSLRSVPFGSLQAAAPRKLPITMSSMNEDRLLQELGLPLEERNLIEGLSSATVRGRRGSFSEAQMSSTAIAGLAANPPPNVGTVQRISSWALLRCYPLGLRFSGNNMSPVPSCLGGVHDVACAI